MKYVKCFELFHYKAVYCLTLQNLYTTQVYNSACAVALTNVISSNIVEYVSPFTPFAEKWPYLQLIDSEINELGSDLDTII